MTRLIDTYFEGYGESGYDIKWCYSQARRIIRGIIFAWPDLAPDEEDLVQMTVASATHCAAKQLKVTRAFIRQLASVNISKLMGDKKWNGRRAVRDGEVPWEEWHGGQKMRNELGAIALWRLQRIWPTLSENQRLAMNCYLTGGSWIELERQHGPTAANFQRSLKEVLQKLNGERAIGSGNGAFKFGGTVRSGRAAVFDRRMRTQKAS